MNYIITSILSLFFVLNTILSIPFEEVETAFANGEAKKIMNLGTTKVLISIEGEEGIYSKSQGTQILEEFFKKNPPQSFLFNFKGKDKGASSFAVAEYQSKRLFRVSFKFKKVNNNHLIESITFTPQHED